MSRPLTVLQTDVYARWFEGLRDQRAKARIAVRVRRLSLGNPGDVKSLGGGISEMRVDYGPGYRVYFAARTDSIMLLLTGGDKSGQRRDIAKARQLAADWKQAL